MVATTSGSYYFIFTSSVTSLKAFKVKFTSVESIGFSHAQLANMAGRGAAGVRQVMFGDGMIDLFDNSNHTIKYP